MLPNLATKLERILENTMSILASFFGMIFFGFGIATVGAVLQFTMEGVTEARHKELTSPFFIGCTSGIVGAGLLTFAFFG